MENRKRARLLVEDAHALPNLLFTICDDAEDDDDDDVGMDEEDTQEFLIGSAELAAHIKQEQETQTPLPVQYRIVSSNQFPHRHIQTEAATTTTLIPTAVQLPSGCEIYLVKEYVEPIVTASMPPRILTNTSVTTGTAACNAVGGTASDDAVAGTLTIAGNHVGYAGNSINHNMDLLCGNIAAVLPNTTVASRTIKVEPRQTTINAGGVVSDVSGSINRTHNISNNTDMNATAMMTRNGVHIVRRKVTTTTNASTSTTVTAGTATVNNGKRSYILETYKKRDDKRRATHNEVERRRRDKINSWIFKLKEMLPADSSNCNSIKITRNNPNNNNSNFNLTAQQKQPAFVSTSGSSNNNNQNNNNNNNNSNSNRTTNDSKSQILIKACDYIKTMQDEIISLRECLTENANLRSCNQRLENELSKLKAAYAKLNNHTYTSTHNSHNNNNIKHNISSSNNNSHMNAINKFNLTLNSLNSCNSRSSSNNNPNSNTNTNNSIFMSANNALEILPVVAEFDSALLLAAATSNSNNNNNSPSSSSSSSSSLLSASNPSLTYVSAKHELILNDLNI